MLLGDGRRPVRSLKVETAACWLALSLPRSVCVRSRILPIRTESPIACARVSGLRSRHQGVARLHYPPHAVEYLWLGLPVIVNARSEIATHVADYDAGWPVDAADERHLAAVADAILENRRLLCVKSRNARQLAKARFSWERCVAPIHWFFQSPSLRGEKMLAGRIRWNWFLVKQAHARGGMPAALRYASNLLLTKALSAVGLRR